jgi:hypothetical protein
MQWKERPDQPERSNCEIEWIQVSEISRDNGCPSNLIQIFWSERSEAQTFCAQFNSLIVLADLVVLWDGKCPV